MKIAIVTNMNGIGLQRDFELLREYLESLDHEVRGFQFDEAAPLGTNQFDIVLFLEVIPRDYLRIAPVAWLFANVEWLKPDVLKLAERHCDRVFAKTTEAHRIMKPIFGERCVYTGFMARDQYDATVKREDKFLHIGGNSAIRGTQEVLDAWKWKKDGEGIAAELTIVSRVLKDREPVPGVMILSDVDEDELKRLQNSHRFHIYPSQTEGYGHAIHEALGVGAVVLTLDAPPMNEIKTAIHIPARKRGSFNLADLYETSAIDIHHAVRFVTQDDLVSKGENIDRKLFLSANDDFKMRFSAELKGLAGRSKARPKRTKADKSILFLGNFAVAESTENMIKWALEERLGYEVEALQENETTLHMLQDAAEYNDAFLWVRTPSYLRVADEEMFAYLDYLQARKIPSFGIHLDKFFGIPEREKLIGKIPFWKMKFLFTADGSRDEDFRRAGVNHIWMRPAMSEVYCHPGIPREEYRCDVGFVGSRDYHAEYPFRRQLVEFLETTYPSCKIIESGLRGHALNDFYASCKIVVGDCFAAGLPRYYSDRAPETAGRGGFLLHPMVPGLDIPCAIYEPQDVDDLKENIAFWMSRGAARRDMVRGLIDHIRNNHTWTVRLRQILKTVLP